MIKLVQPARSVSRDVLEEVEQELENYNFYKDFLELSTAHQLTISKLTNQRIGTVKIIEKASKKLPPHLQLFVKNRYIDGLTMEQVAENMNISTSTCYKYRKQVLYKFAIVLGKL